MPRIVFFVHHQGRGHANRASAIIEELSPQNEVTILTADPHLFAGKDMNAQIVPLPNMIGARSRTPGLFAVPTPSVMHCVPLGVDEQRRAMSVIAETLGRLDPALFVIDVSAEIALLARILSVPAVKIRMHGSRLDPGHLAAYEACTAMLAPFDEALEQPDYPDWARAKTFYSGGLCTTSDPVPSRETARQRLQLPADQRIVVVLTGGGGGGTPYAPLTMAARALPDARFIVLGPVHREGHETDFFNLELRGWVPNVTDYLAAADTVIASAGDNTVHEIARVNRPFICAPEWRYFDEQTAKGRQLERLGAAVLLANWPGSLPDWKAVVRAVDVIDTEKLAKLYAPDAAKSTAKWLTDLAERLWSAE